MRLYVAFGIACAIHYVAGECADVIDATVRRDCCSDTWSFSATVSSADTGWEKYADAWEIRTVLPSNGTAIVLGTRVLAHPHVNEQPFTRSLSRIELPDEVDNVTIAARDSVAGWCGEVFHLEIPRESMTDFPTASPREETTIETFGVVEDSSSVTSCHVRFISLLSLIVLWTF